jgi:hypothetical protein
VLKPAIAVLIASGLVVGAILWLPGLLRTHTASGQVFIGQLELRNKDRLKLYTITPPEANVWHRDEGVERKFKALTAIYRKDPEAWFAVTYKDFGTRSPGEAEMQTEALARLDGYFTDDLQWDYLPEGRVSGQRARRLQFRGKLNNVVSHGECWMLHHQGFGFWLYIWAGRKQIAEQEFAHLHRDPNSGFVLAGERRGWTEQPPETTSFKSEKYPFSLEAAKGTWTREEPEEREVDLLLKGKDAVDFRKSATAAVIVLKKEKMNPKKAMEEAQKYLIEQARKEEDSLLIQVAAELDRTGEALGRERKFGGLPGQVAELELSRGEENPRRHYAVLAVVTPPHADHFFVVKCECAWEHNARWRLPFLDLVGSFRVHKGGKD